MKVIYFTSHLSASKDHKFPSPLSKGLCLFIILYKMVLTVESVDENLHCDGDLSRLQRRDHELARNR